MLALFLKVLWTAYMWDLVRPSEMPGRRANGLGPSFATKKLKGLYINHPASVARKSATAAITAMMSHTYKKNRDAIDASEAKRTALVASDLTGIEATSTKIGNDIASYVTMLEGNEDATPPRDVLLGMLKATAKSHMKLGAHARRLSMFIKYGTGNNTATPDPESESTIVERS
ncbi:hypothetical protein K505DRAFT_421104 [Melanomma pulvis-pyrius CBS 109.77]|uniref:Uncharacterized protein n=1 Tax=Melanomma pulvis-pyrius CBS 109.77 TaxID=1314802 RepID=A0A6A6WX18_9PLEO|nr:hypothetical protein K505DRAFT_421104 [Melanomma pulvis-pyrius CBS 109.77]